MGWYGIYKPYKQSFRETLEKEINNTVCKVLDCSIVKRNTAYMACKNIVNGDVFALVVKIKFSPTVTYGANFWYKDMDEDMLPYFFDCPKRILDLLTPARTDSAREWRETCLRSKQEKRSKVYCQFAKILIDEALGR